LKTNIIHVVGARPNFMKAAPVISAIAGNCVGVEQKLIHSGQHYDAAMSDVFFEQLGLPHPDVNLGVGAGPHGAQTAQIMVRLEEFLTTQKPDLALVYGDVNSTVAAALVCAKMGIQLGHVEAGLRSFDRSMPEEINRVVTDQLADMHFTPSVDGDENLMREGISREKIHRVGNVMIDTLVRLRGAAKAKWPEVVKTLGTGFNSGNKFILVTLHRPSNVDDPLRLTGLMKALQTIAKKVQVVFPVHPRTSAQIQSLGTMAHGTGGLLLTSPLAYLEFLALQERAALVVTDSGGIQEETTFLGVPCLTMRKNTERPVTVEQGTNELVSEEPERLPELVEKRLTSGKHEHRIPELWDGKASERIAEILKKKFL